MRALLVVAAFVATPVFAQDLHDLVRRLDDPAWEEREDAERRLAALGPAARPALESYLDSADLEVAGRIWRLCDDLSRGDSPEGRAAWIARGPGFADLASRWAVLRERLLGGEREDAEQLVEEMAVETLELEREVSREKLSNDAVVGKLARAVDRRIEVARRSRQGARMLRKFEQVRSGWLGLMDEACRTGTLRGQAVEDLLLFLLDPEDAPDASDFGDEHDRRTAFALLVALESDRNFGPGPARSWTGAWERIASRELFARTAARARAWRAGEVALVRIEELRKKVELEVAVRGGHDGVAFELAIYPSLLAVREELERPRVPFEEAGSLEAALGPIDAEWSQDAWIRRAGEIAGRVRTRPEVERELLRRLEE